MVDHVSLDNLSVLIDWLIVLGITPYRQYSSHVTAALCLDTSLSDIITDGFCSNIIHDLVELVDSDDFVVLEHAVLVIASDVELFSDSCVSV